MISLLVFQNIDPDFLIRLDPKKYTFMSKLV